MLLSNEHRTEDKNQDSAKEMEPVKEQTEIQKPARMRMETSPYIGAYSSVHAAMKITGGPQEKKMDESFHPEDIIED